MCTQAKGSRKRVQNQLNHCHKPKHEHATKSGGKKHTKRRKGRRQVAGKKKKGKRNRERRWAWMGAMIETATKEARRLGKKEGAGQEGKRQEGKGTGRQQQACKSMACRQGRQAYICRQEAVAVAKVVKRQHAGRQPGMWHGEIEV